jgi:hypothetical protein
VYFVVSSDRELDLTVLLSLPRWVQGFGSEVGVAKLSNYTSNNQGSIFGFASKANRSIFGFASKANRSLL